MNVQMCKPVYSVEPVIFLCAGMKNLQLFFFLSFLFSEVLHMVYLVISGIFSLMTCCVYFAEFGVHLAELTVDPQGALAIRQVSI